MTIRIELHGAPRLIAAFAKAEGVARVALAKALYAEGLAIFGESQREVPIDTGTLRSSGYVKPPTTSSSEIEVQVGYGGAAQEYALIVHERMDTYHKPPTKAKYLEDPAMRAAKGMDKRLAVVVGAAMKGLGTL